MSILATDTIAFRRYYLQRGHYRKGRLTVITRNQILRGQGSQC